MRLLDKCAFFGAFSAGRIVLILSFFPRFHFGLHRFLSFAVFGFFCTFSCTPRSGPVCTVLGLPFFSSAPRWYTLASDACATKCVFALLLLATVQPCTSFQVSAGWGPLRKLHFGCRLFSRASFLRLFVGGQLLRRAHLFSRWFSGWPFSSQLLISDFHLAPALLGSAAGTPGRRSIFGCMHVLNWFP